MSDDDLREPPGLRRLTERLHRIETRRNRFAAILKLHDPENMPHGMSADYYVGWHRAIEAALRVCS